MNDNHLYYSDDVSARGACRQRLCFIVDSKVLALSRLVVMVARGCKAS